MKLENIRKRFSIAWEIFAIKVKEIFMFVKKVLSFVFVIFSYSEFCRENSFDNRTFPTEINRWTKSKRAKFSEKNEKWNVFQFEIIEQELIESSSNGYHGIRDIRNSVLMNPVCWFSIFFKKAIIRLFSTGTRMAKWWWRRSKWRNLCTITNIESWAKSIEWFRYEWKSQSGMMMKWNWNWGC